MSKKKKKKNKKKKMHRLRELQGLGRVETAGTETQKEVPFEPKVQAEEKEETVLRVPKKQEAPVKLSENVVFYKDLRRVGIIILITLVILIGLWLAFKYTNISSYFNFPFLK